MWPLCCIISIMLRQRNAGGDKSGICSSHFITVLSKKRIICTVSVIITRHYYVFNACFLFPRRKKDDNITFDTFCHSPAEKLHGLFLDDYNNTKCEMKERKGMDSQFFICSCNEDECNEFVLFNPSEFALSRQRSRSCKRNVDTESTFLFLFLQGNMNNKLEPWERSLALKCSAVLPH